MGHARSSLLVQAFPSTLQFMVNRSSAPAVAVWRSEDGTHWTVQIDTADDVGPLAVDLNDGRIFLGDPETFDVMQAAEDALRRTGAGGLLSEESLRALAHAVRGEAG